MYLAARHGEVATGESGGGRDPVSDLLLQSFIIEVDVAFHSFLVLLLPCLLYLQCQLAQRFRMGIGHLAKPSKRLFRRCLARNGCVQKLEKTLPSDEASETKGLG